MIADSEQSKILHTCKNDSINYFEVKELNLFVGDYILNSSYSDKDIRKQQLLITLLALTESISLYSVNIVLHPERNPEYTEFIETYPQ